MKLDGTSTRLVSGRQRVRVPPPALWPTQHGRSVRRPRKAEPVGSSPTVGSYGVVAHQVRAPLLQSGGKGFESPLLHSHPDGQIGKGAWRRTRFSRGSTPRPGTYVSGLWLSLVRALGPDPRGRAFESRQPDARRGGRSGQSRPAFTRDTLRVRGPSAPRNTSPCSSTGRAPVLHTGDRGFESLRGYARRWWL